MQTGPLSLKRAFSEGIATFKKQPGTSIGGFLVGYFIGASAWPFIGGPMAGGICRLFLKIARNEEAEIGEVFRCFDDFWKWMGIIWLWMGIFYACLIPIILLAFLNMAPLMLMESAGSHPNIPTPLIVRIVIVHIVLVFIGMLLIDGAVAKWGFAFFEGLGEGGVLDAFRRSSELTKGHLPRLWFMVIVLRLFSGLGVLACYFGMFVTTAISMNIATEIYLELKRLQSERLDTPQEIAPAQ